MTSRVSMALAATLLLAAPMTGHASVSAYTQSFESLVQADPNALGNDGWFVFGNAYTLAHVYKYGYGPFPAPNTGGNAFCAIVTGQGGALQGAQQLSVYSDYNNADQATSWIESNVYREQTISAADVGGVWTFQFDAKLGNLASPSTAVAFIKTLDPSHGYALTNFLTLDMTAIPATWNTYTISIPLKPALSGQLVQFGFANTVTNYISSGVFYDNVTWTRTGNVDVAGGPRAGVLELTAAAPNPFAGATHVGFSLARRGAADVGVYDVAGRRVATLFHGQAPAGATVARWDGRSADGRLAPAGVYRCVLQTAEGRRVTTLVLNR